jgi:hypothetical protein
MEAALARDVTTVCRLEGEHIKRAVEKLTAIISRDE